MVTVRPDHNTWQENAGDRRGYLRHQVKPQVSRRYARSGPRPGRVGQVRMACCTPPLRPHQSQCPRVHGEASRVASRGLRATDTEQGSPRPRRRDHPVRRRLGLPRLRRHRLRYGGARGQLVGVVVHGAGLPRRDGLPVRGAAAGGAVAQGAGDHVDPGVQASPPNLAPSGASAPLADLGRLASPRVAKVHPLPRDTPASQGVDPAAVIGFLDAVDATPRSSSTA